MCVLSKDDRSLWRMMCGNVDVGARSFAECQPAALAPGPGYYASLCRLEMASKVIIHRRRAGGPSRLGWSVRHI